jgi:transketolase
MHSDDYEFKLGKADVIKEGKDITLIGCGVILSRLMEAVKQLEKSGYEATIINMPTIKPFDAETVIKAGKRTGAILTVEEHNIIGGLGSAVCEAVAKEYIPVSRVGIPDTFAESGDYDQLLDKYGLAVKDIYNSALNLIKNKKNIM